MKVYIADDDGTILSVVSSAELAAELALEGHSIDAGDITAAVQEEIEFFWIKDVKAHKK